jgi:hypothetical protein
MSRRRGVGNLRRNAGGDVLMFVKQHQKMSLKVVSIDFYNQFILPQEIAPATYLSRTRGLKGNNERECRT